ncbi:MAG: CRTAC1 family protein [Bacteroidales bacterium]|nr:CRTAC1 family protein [Bacteroidales bacterium]
MTAQIKFEDVTEKAGLVEPLKGIAGHCAVFGDANGDDYPELFVGTFTHFEDSVYNQRGHTTGKEPDKFFINRGDGTFVEDKECPASVKGKCSGGAFADLDNDGDMDLIISRQAHLKKWPGDLLEAGIERNMLLENDGKGNFRNVTFHSGVDLWYPFMGRSTFVFDYDGDGLLDIFMQEDFTLGDVSAGNSRLLKNMGHLKFKDVTKEAGFPTGYQQGLYGLGGFVDDINGDTWPDVFFSHSCRLFINNRNGTFRELPFKMPDPKYTLPSNINIDYAYYCGANTGDLDNDGDLDFVVGDHLEFESAKHRLFVFQNQGNDASGNPVFKDITEAANIGNFGGRAIYIQIADIDNDGKMDICTSRYKNFIYKNNGVEKGIPKFDQPFDAGSESKTMNYWAGGSFADFDRDGRLDFFGPEWYPEDKARLLRNISPNAGNYIDVKLELGKAPNRNGIGAKVEIFKAGSLGNAEECLGTHIISVANGYASGYEAIAHFGLPDNEKVDIRVTMPCDGQIYEKTSVGRNQLLKLKK